MPPTHYLRRKQDIVLVVFFTALTAVLITLPTGFDDRVRENAVRCQGEVIRVDDNVQQLGMIKKGHQQVTVKLLDGRFEGRVVTGENPLMGRLDIDKLYRVGDRVLMVLTLNQAGEIIFVNPQDHYRLSLELALFGLFALLLLAFGGWTGARALLSFVFAGVMIWKVLAPLLLKGVDPLFLSMSMVAGLSAAVIFLVAGPTPKGLVAFLGAFMGVLTCCALALWAAERFHVHGAVMPFAETLLYSGFGHLDLTKIYIAAVFLAASGAVMDLAMDVSASMHEVILNNPTISRAEAVKSGFRVGRAVVGTMTTTLLLAYSGGYVTLLMAFMAQGVPLANMFNLIYVAAEILKTVVGSFGLVTVAPFTAVIGALIFRRVEK